MKIARLLIICIASVALIVLGIALFWKSNDVPDLKVPIVPAPVPNGFDFFVRAGIPRGDEEELLNALDPVTTHVTLAQQEAVLAKHTESLALLTQGLQYDCAGEQPRNELIPSYNQYNHLVNLGRLLQLDGRVREAKRDYAGADKDGLDDIIFGQKLSRDGPVQGVIDSDHCQMLGQRLLWNDLGRLSASQCKAFAVTLSRNLMDHYSVADAIRAEEWSGQSARLMEFRKTDWRSAMTSDTLKELGIRKPGQLQLMLDISLGLTNPSQLLARFTARENEEVSKAAAPYSTHGPPKLIANDPVQALAEAQLSYVGMLDINSMAKFDDAFVQTQDMLLECSLALRAYYLQYGRYPATLSAMVPTYLPTVPSDPFALSGPVRYRLAASGYSLYSVGPDGHDDNGTPIVNASSPPQPRHGAAGRYFVSPQSQGDILAGVNTNGWDQGS